MSVVKHRVLACLVSVLLLSVAAAAQGEPPPLVSLVAVPEGGVQVLVTRLAASSQVAVSALLPPGGSQAPGAGTFLGGEVQPAPLYAQHFLTRYTDLAGGKHELDTYEEPTETADAHAVRHAAALAVLLSLFPPAPDAPSWLGTPLIEPGEQILKTAWKGADGLDHEVVTARKPNENMDKWAERHADGVAAMLKLFPPKPGFAAAVVRGVARVA